MRERERRQYDPVKHLKGHCQIFKAFNKKWHLPPLLSLYFFLKHEKSSKMYSFEDQNALSLFDIILVAHTEKKRRRRSAVCSFDGSPVMNQFTGSKSSGASFDLTRLWYFLFDGSLKWHTLSVLRFCFRNNGLGRLWLKIGSTTTTTVKTGKRG